MQEREEVMKCMVAGIRRGMSFRTKEGNEIRGSKIHLVFPDSNVEGRAVDSFFISDSSPAFPALSKVAPEKEVEVLFNRYGKVDSIAPV